LNATVTLLRWPYPGVSDCNRSRSLAVIWTLLDGTVRIPVPYVVGKCDEVI
jgi:hypothetical protein